jgi:hypothetical protein
VVDWGTVAETVTVDCAKTFSKNKGSYFWPEKKFIKKSNDKIPPTKNKK